MAITLNGTTLTVTGGTSTAPITLADIQAAYPANLINQGNYWQFIGINLIQFGDNGTTPTYFLATNAIIDADRLCEIKPLGAYSTTSDTVIRFGETDIVTSIGKNGCVLTKNIKVTGVAGEIHFYASTVEEYTAIFYFAFLYASDNKFVRCGDRIGRTYLWRRNTVQSSDRNGGSTLIPGFANMFDPAPTGNTRIFSDTDEIIFVTNSKAEGETLYISKNAKIVWAYNNAKAINYGKLPQNNVSQITQYNDSKFNTLATPIWEIVDQNDTIIPISNAQLSDSQGNTYLPSNGTDLPNGKIAFNNVILQEWLDRPGGQTGIINYTDFGPHILTITDTSGAVHTLQVDMSTRWNEGEIRKLYIPNIVVAPQVARIVLTETTMKNNEPHTVYYTDAPGLTVTFSLDYHDSTGAITKVVTGTMQEIENGVYRYILDLPNLTLPSIPDYYMIRVDTGASFSAQSIEIILPENQLTPQNISNEVWNEGRALTVGKFLALK